MVVGFSEGRKPLPPQGERNKYIIQKGVFQVDSKNFWFISLCALLIASQYTGMNLPLRAAIAANAVDILFDLVKRATRLFDERKKGKL